MLLHVHIAPVHEQLHRLQEAAGGLWGKQWIKAAVRTGLGGVSLAVMLAVAAQLAYPQSRALPQTIIGGKNYGYQSSQQITADIAAQQQRKLRIVSGDLLLEYKPAQLGITLDGAKDANRAMHYSWTERLIPFSFLWERREVAHYSLKVDDKRAAQFAALLKQYDQLPVDAEVHLEGGKVTVRQHQNGYAYDPAKIKAAIKGMKLTSGLSAVLEPEVTSPKVTDAMAAEAASAAQQRLQRPIEVKAADKSLTASPEQIAGWIEFKADGDNQELHVSYNKGKIRQWLTQLADQVYIASKPRTVTFMDGVEVGAVDGAEGRALNTDDAVEAVLKAAAEGESEVRAAVRPVMPSAQTVRNYGRSSQGLQALLQYWDESHRGTWGIVLRQLDGGLTASLNPDRQFTSASVYKLYVAYVVYSRLDSGELKMDTDTGNGKDVSTCLDVMIVRSDNPCAEALGKLIGWDANDGMLHARGFGSTSIGYGHQLTTAQDATTYLVQLQNGTLMSGGNREALLHKMRNNIYRYAIPAATPGVASVNKLGTVGNFNHDVAIVYHPKGAYTLAIFTQGSDHGQIRELAKQIANVMGQ